MKKIFLALFIASICPLSAQQQESRKFIWGIETGFETQLTNIQSLGWNEPDKVPVAAERHAQGGSAGVFGRWQIWKGLSLQSSFSVTSLPVKIRFDEGVYETFRFTDLEVPLHFVMTNPGKNFPLRGSILIGGRLGWNMAGQPSDKVFLLRERLALDAGMGVEIRLKNWRLQPELVYSHGLNNIHDVRNAPYDWVIGRIVRDRLTVRILVWREP